MKTFRINRPILQTINYLKANAFTRRVSIKRDGNTACIITTDNPSILYAFGI